MIRAQHIAASCTAIALAAASLLVATPAEASSSVCYLKYYDNPLIPGTQKFLVPESDLSYGSTDYCVSGWQRQINHRYGDVLTVDSVFGQNTRAWTRLIQDTSTYSWCAGGVDGIAGPKTISCFEYENGISIW
ncbi:peptidoglycan-binding protein [Streptomyces sp. NPDC091280]|uniref:peptidoglycan-binding domain-containing protein n=1 Tax=unclassified Streptomyces TaxID=2593676 RepID=UPI003803C854